MPYISFDNERVGFMQGEAILKAAPKGATTCCRESRRQQRQVVQGRGDESARSGDQERRHQDSRRTIGQGLAAGQCAVDYQRW